MDDVQRTEEYIKGFVAGGLTTLNHLMYRVKAECSFGIITHQKLEELILEMIDVVDGEQFTKGGDVNG